MASTATSTTNGQSGRTTLANPAVLEKKVAGSVGRSTPDSEAVASSDDDHDQSQTMSMSMHSVKSLPPSGPPRRPSWLSEVQQSSANNKQRKFSLSGQSYASSAGSQPTTPSGENGPWDVAAVARAGASGSSYPWGSQVWQQKDRSRLMEVMPSHVSMHDDMRSPTFQSQMANGGLPFDIPLEPSRKTVRSQSYSAGQLENMSGFENTNPHAGYPRNKTGLMHRPSRPSMLGDGMRDTLGSLREDEDDIETPNGADHTFSPQSAAPRPGSGRGFSSMNRASATSPPLNGAHRYQMRQAATFPANFPLSPESDYAVADDNDDNDSLSDLGRAVARGIANGSTSSASTIIPSTASAIENRRLEGLRRSQWQSSLGFGIVEEGSQSRRHSFAELPSRTRNSPMATHPSLMQPNQYQGYTAGPSTLGALLPNNDPFHHRDHVAEERKSYNFSNSNPHRQHFYQRLVQLQQEEENIIVRAQINDKSYAAAYFSGPEAQRRHIREPQNDDYNPFAVPNVFGRPVKILYLVAFKCNRADIYYIPENTGLQVKTGDTVIVEGDRGQDLGTVEHVNISMDQAKQLKEEYTQKHFRCLMMFSRLYPHIAHLAGDDDAFANSISGTGASGNTPVGPNFSPDPATFETEPRPKMIKRVARPDEVHLLREKEGNEAKAKRVCQTKVNDHGLRMEILDAEFQQWVSTFGLSRILADFE
jgi:hypothetical protein